MEEGHDEKHCDFIEGLPPVPGVTIVEDKYSLGNDNHLFKCDFYGKLLYLFGVIFTSVWGGISVVVSIILLVALHDPSEDFDLMLILPFSFCYIFTLASAIVLYLGIKEKKNKLWIEVTDEYIVLEKGVDYTGNGVKFQRDPNVTRIEEEVTRSRMGVNSLYHVYLTDGQTKFKVAPHYPSDCLEKLEKMLKKMISSKGK